MNLSLAFQDNSTGHNDLILTINDSAWRCDSYYLALDQGILSEQEDAEKIRTVLRALLEQWKAAVRALPHGGCVYLPYDFSDQYTAWLECLLDGEQIRIRRGWSTLEGWSIAPSDVSPHMSTVAGFQPDAGPWTLPRAEFLRAIDLSIEAAA